ncbi:thioredoxin family protein [Desulfomonile tiedjei]|uniref:Thioredoxin-like fold domain-containing protein n=1 Tax=Desulfomonile tiedjei (strain ATCC 49306 / DSM 6799 / DCB-1) TaxID=706587 RepID=I4CEI9_DESTA|nr:thioredoxin family protein [Desulfomonile tiedjei]AFM27980.1 hypothetical protein Desti_5392 [Desulfomonile tiedjei DSM 6799]
MADDGRQIWIGEDKIHIRGLDKAIEEIARTHSGSTDREIQDALLERLSEKNYMASCAIKEYGEAFLREFKRFLGQPCTETSRTSLRIEVLGPGCSQCNRLEQIVKQVLDEMALPASLEHIADMKEMAKYGLVRTPALVINEKVVAMGSVPPVKKIREWLTQSKRT